MVPNQNLSLYIGKDQELFKRDSSLYLARSPFFAGIIRERGGVLEPISLHLKELPVSFFHVIDSFITEGIDKTWVLEEKELLLLIPFLELYGLKELKSLAFQVLTRYFTKENILSQIEEAYKKEWWELEERAVSFFNAHEEGVFLKVNHKGFLSFEVKGYGEDVFDFFKALKKRVKELVFHYMISEDALFGELLKDALEVHSLDISRTVNFPEGLYKFKGELLKLNISENKWVEDLPFKKIAELFPHLKTLNISACPSLTFQGFLPLKNLENLENLDISRNLQVKDDLLSLLLLSLPSLKKLNLEGCSKLTSKSFLELARGLPLLNTLNIASCPLEKGVFKYLCSSLPFLKKIDIQRIEILDEKKISEGLFLNTRIKYVVLSDALFSLEAKEYLKKNHPFVHFEYL